MTMTGSRAEAMRHPGGTPIPDHTIPYVNQSSRCKEPVKGSVIDGKCGKPHIWKGSESD